MKKFLSLLLALVMTMSLVTISAGATEYKDLTDKDELGPQYQEAVAVLNKIGVITGYDDGSFRPDVELTRGAAAKIIVSLLIGPEAANNLPNNSSPYPDVPASHTFAGVISFCKTAEIINGYGDGTFKPANDLTGYAFAKMLLSALGYDNNAERFVGTGWTNNVLKIGQEASLFDRLDFKGSDAVTRKDAALLALNTLKATVVEYNNPQTITVTGENTNVVVNGGQVRSYKTSNQDYARNILPQRRDIANTTTSRADYNTVEFAEEHFIDLRLPHDKYDPVDDDYGRPSAEWSYKKLSIGKFPLVPDFEYTSQVAHNIVTVTPASKVRALGLNGYTVTRTGAEAATVGSSQTASRLWINGYYVGTLAEVADIADLTDNGTLVEVYVDNNGSDFITDVVVIKSQLMEIKKVGADSVTLDTLKPDGESKDALLNVNQTPIYGFNQEPIELRINNVETGDEYFEFLSGLKVGDAVVVEPVSVDHGNTSFDVGYAYVPETAKGALNGVPDRFGDTSNKYSALSLDVGGTTYKVSLWNDEDLTETDPDAVKVTKKDVTLTLDRYGYILTAADVGSIDGWLIIKNYRQSIENGILVTYANGWDLDGNEVSLNIGARAGVSNWTNELNSNDVWDQNALPRIGSLVKYKSSTTSNTADWDLYQTNKMGVYNVYRDSDEGVEPYYIRANSSTVTVENATNGVALKTVNAYRDTDTFLMANNIKFIYVTFDDSGELDTIEIRTGRTKVENNELTNAVVQAAAGHGRAQAAVKWKNDDQSVNENASVEAVVIKQDNSDASYKNLMYIVSNEGASYRDANGQMVQTYKVAMLDANDKIVITDIYAYRTNLQVGDFARYTKSTHEDHPDDFYTLRRYTGGIGKSAATWSSAILENYKTGNKNLWTIEELTTAYNIGTTQADDRNVYANVKTDDNKDSFADWMLNLKGAAFHDMSKYTYTIDSVDDLKEAFDDGNEIKATLLFNDDPESDYFRSVYMIIITSVTPKSGGGIDNSGDVRYADRYNTDGTMGGPITGNISVAANGSYQFNFSFKAPDWAAGNYTVNWTVYSRLKDTGDWVPQFVSTSSITAAVPSNRIVTGGVGWQNVTLPAGSEVKVEITSVSYSRAVVKYYKDSISAANEIDVDTLKNTAGTGAAPEDLAAGAGETFDFSYLTSDTTATVKVDVTGITTTYEDQGMTGQATPTRYNLNGGTTLAASGDGYVNVVIRGLGSIRRTVKFAADLTFGGGPTNHQIPTLATWFTSADGLESPLTSLVDLSVLVAGNAIDTTTDTVPNGSRVTLRVNNGLRREITDWLIVELVDVPGCEAGPQIVKGDAYVDFVIENITEDIEISKANIKMTTIGYPKVVAGAVVEKDGLYWTALQFDKPISRIEDGGNEGNTLGDVINNNYVSATNVKLADDGKTVLIGWYNDPTPGFIVPVYSFITEVEIGGETFEFSNKPQPTGAGWTADLTDGTIKLDTTVLPKVDVSI